MFTVNMIISFMGNRVQPSALESAKERMTEVANERGICRQSTLEYVLGDPKLVRALKDVYKSPVELFSDPPAFYEREED